MGACATKPKVLKDSTEAPVLRVDEEAPNDVEPFNVADDGLTEEVKRDDNLEKQVSPADHKQSLSSLLHKDDVVDVAAEVEETPPEEIKVLEADTTKEAVQSQFSTNEDFADASSSPLHVEEA